MKVANGGWFNSTGSNPVIGQAFSSLKSPPTRLPDVNYGRSPNKEMLP